MALSLLSPVLTLNLVGTVTIFVLSPDFDGYYCRDLGVRGREREKETETDKI